MPVRLKIGLGRLEVGQLQLVLRLTVDGFRFVAFLEINLLH